MGLNLVVNSGQEIYIKKIIYLINYLNFLLILNLKNVNFICNAVD